MLDFNSKNVGAILFFAGFGLIFTLWIGVIVPSNSMRELMVLITFIAYVQLQEHQYIWWPIYDAFDLFILGFSGLMTSSMPHKIISIDTNIFFYISMGLTGAGAILILGGSR